MRFLCIQFLLAMFFSASCDLVVTASPAPDAAPATLAETAAMCEAAGVSVTGVWVPNPFSRCLSTAIELQVRAERNGEFWATNDDHTRFDSLAEFWETTAGAPSAPDSWHAVTGAHWASAEVSVDGVFSNGNAEARAAEPGDKAESVAVLA
jgi:hypothetical protein